MVVVASDGYEVTVTNSWLRGDGYEVTGDENTVDVTERRERREIREGDRSGVS